MSYLHYISWLAERRTRGAQPSAARRRTRGARASAALLAGAALLILSSSLPATTAAQEDPPDPKPFIFRGNVRDFVNEHPLAEAIVQIAEVNRSAITDRNGYFEFPELLPGRYTIITARFGYQTNREESRVPHNAIMVVRLQPIAVVLPGIEVRVERLVHRLEVRRVSTPVGSTVFREEVLQATNSPSVAALVRARTPVYILEDPTFQQLVYRFRGRIRRLRVCLDEVGVSSRFLETLAPDDLELVEIYERLGMVRMYTRDFLRRAAGEGFSPTQIALQGRGC